MQDRVEHVTITCHAISASAWFETTSCRVLVLLSPLAILRNKLQAVTPCTRQTAICQSLKRRELGSWSCAHRRDTTRVATDQENKPRKILGTADKQACKATTMANDVFY